MAAGNKVDTQSTGWRAGTGKPDTLTQHISAGTLLSTNPEEGYAILDGIAARMRSGFILLNQAESVAYANVSAQRLLGPLGKTASALDVREQLLARASNPADARTALDDLWVHQEEEGGIDIALADAAVRWLRANAHAYQLDPARIGVWGYSSGGFLASFLGIAANEPSFDDSSEFADYSCQVQAVFTVSNPVDFLQMGGEHDAPDSAEARLIGGPVQENPELVRRANPLTYLKGYQTLPPFHITHGECDVVVLPNQSSMLYEALLAAHCDATLLILPNAGHALGHSTIYWEPVGNAAIAFFQRHLLN